MNETILDEYFKAADPEAFIKSLILRAEEYVNGGFNTENEEERFLAFIGIRSRGVNIGWGEFKERLDELVSYDKTHPGSFKRLFEKRAALPAIEFSAVGANIMDAGNVNTEVLDANAEALADIKDRIDDLAWMEEDFAGSKIFTARNLYYQARKAEAIEEGKLKPTERFSV